jgi:hypothetical protein
MVKKKQTIFRKIQKECTMRNRPRKQANKQGKFIHKIYWAYLSVANKKGKKTTHHTRIATTDLDKEGTTPDLLANLANS